MGREEGGGFRMGNTCIIFFKLKLKKKKEIQLRAAVLQVRILNISCQIKKNKKIKTGKKKATN